MADKFGPGAPGAQLPAAPATPDAGSMLNQETLLEIEALALEMLQRNGFDPDRSPSMDLLCKRDTGAAPHYTRTVGCKGDITPLGGAFIVRVHVMLPTEIKRHTIGHELGEKVAIERGMTFSCLAEREAWCDAFGACLVAPRPAFRRATKRIGHRVHALASAFQIAQALALLRIGEVTGRPVALDHPVQPITRGEPFGWPDGPGIAKAIRRPPETVHPVRVGGRLRGLMANAKAWPRAA